ncbi:MAG: hypothetical protein JSS99_08695 [Actinobacteria bacterium]|nr:hypothetical protein [Actinomycetota bacterium]
MSTTAPTAEAVQTFRGRTLEEVLPQIREALGPDAVVLRQRDGLMGGIGGFFQQRFVEVDATAGHARIDTYDEEPETFAALLAEAADAPLRVSTADRCTDPHSSGDPVAELTQAGMSHAFAERLVADAEAHELPFAPDLRTAVRRALARRLPTALPHRAGGLAVAFAGPGSTACADALASAYKRAGRDARAIASLDKARALLQRADADEQVLAVDLPPIAAERAEVDALAARVAQLELDELVVVMPGDLDLPTARALLDRLQPLSPTALALSLDAQDADVGAAVELACTTRLPIAYVQDFQGISPADPATLAERVLR